MKKIALLGSTGSVGTQTLDIVRNNPERFKVVALAAGSNSELLISQAKEFKPSLVSVATKELADEVKLHVSPGTIVLYGEDGLVETASFGEADIVITAIVGSRGLIPTLAAIDAGKSIGLANKETLVTAGELVMARAKERGVAILPVDSEHSAIFQCLNGERRIDVNSITLTASGGSFRDRTRAELQGVTAQQALNHPNWSMGAKITIDSATMVNKGLEVIEAHWLFGLSYDEINVLIHPESIIHSFVEFADHSIVAQLGLPDMRVPIQYALTFPERHASNAGRLDLAAIGKLNFREMDFERYPCLALAYACGRLGGTAPTVYNAANEVAVARFLNGEISFLDIERVLETTVARHSAVPVTGLDAIQEADSWARSAAASI